MPEAIRKKKSLAGRIQRKAQYKGMVHRNQRNGRENKNRRESSQN